MSYYDDHFLVPSKAFASLLRVPLNSVKVTVERVDGFLSVALTAGSPHGNGGGYTLSVASKTLEGAFEELRSAIRERALDAMADLDAEPE